MPRHIVPNNLTLYPYQRESVKRMMTMRRSFLCHEQGLGKSPISIVCSNAWATQHVVVICPAVVRSTWEYEFTRWDTLGRRVLLVSRGSQCVSSDINVIIISYDLASTAKWKDFLVAYLSKDDKSLLICDEAHFLKHHRSNRTQAVLKYIAPAASRLMLLTGTPMTRNIADLHPQLCIVAPKVFGKLADFCYRYSYPVPTPFGSGIEYRGTRNVKELRERLKPFMLRYFKCDVLKDLPPKTYSNVLLDIDAATAKQSLAVLDYVLAQLQEEGYNTDTATDEQQHIATIKRNLGVAKLKPLLAWLDCYLESSPDEPLIIFAYHKVVVAALVSYFSNRSISVTSITGSTTQQERAAAVNGFQRGDYQIIVGNIIACGTGVTLTRSNTVIFAELHWDPASIVQASDRAHRIGTTKPVMVYFMLAKDSLDDHIIDVVKTKMRDIGSVIGGNTNEGEQDDN
jgi:SWI/SNF-related matrix-associated actin-dependent regulator 1 of chromatin subfamily A